MDFPVLWTDQLSIKGALGMLRAAANTDLTIRIAGTTTPATIYSENGTVLNTTGLVRTDAAGNYGAYLSDNTEYDLVYKGVVVRTFDPAPDNENFEAALAHHSAQTSGVHGIPIGEEIATLGQVLDLLNNLPGAGSGNGAPYVLPTASSTTLGGVKVGNTLTMTDGVIDLPSSVSAALGAAAGKYAKPAGGIPLSDLDTSVQSTLSTVAGKYVKPAGGIGEADLSAGVRADLQSARTALQPTSGPRQYNGTANGPAQVGDFKVGDQSFDGSGRRWYCTVAGTNGAAQWSTEPRMTVGTTYPTNPRANDIHVLTT